MMIRHKDPGEESVEQVFARLSWRLVRGFWAKKADSGEDLKFSAGIARRIWEEQGPRKLEMLVRQRGG